MKRILVPLDGSTLAAKILPDAQRLAGPNGRIVLVRNIGGILPPMVWGRTDFTMWRDRWNAVAKESGQYLEALAADLRADGMKVEVYMPDFYPNFQMWRADAVPGDRRSLRGPAVPEQNGVQTPNRSAPLRNWAKSQVYMPLLNDVALSIDEAARTLDADLIACATHGRGVAGRVLQGSVAWSVLAHSTVPVMLRHVDEKGPTPPIHPLGRRIMVPLDGSSRAETALPLAVELAQEWQARIHLVSVIPDLPMVTNPPYGRYDAPTKTLMSERSAMEASLQQKAGQLSVPAYTRVAIGTVVETLAYMVDDLGITDIVLASHGRTGLMRVLLGSVADRLIHRLNCPIVVIPSLAVQDRKTTQAPATGADVPAVPV